MEVNGKENNMPRKNWFDKAKTTMETAGSKLRAAGSRAKSGASKTRVSAKLGGAMGAGIAIAGVAKRVKDRQRGE